MALFYSKASINLLIRNKAIYHDYDRALAYPPFKTERDSVATGGIKCYAGNWFATAVYKKAYIKEQINNMIVL